MKPLTSCPLCGGHRLEPYASQARQPHQLHHAQARCKDCRLLLAQPQAEAEELEAYYGAQYYEQAPMDPESTREVTRRQYLRYELPILERLWRDWPPPAGARVFEVGSGLGTLVEILRARGFEASGCDLSPTAAKDCRERGLDVAHAGFEDLDPATEPFDAVMAMQVIEHVPDLAAFVQALVDRAKPGGLVVIGTEDGWTSEYQWSRLRARLRGRTPRYHTSTDHTYVLRARHLADLLEDAGCDAVRTCAYTCVPEQESLHWKLYKGLFRSIDRLLGHGELLLAVSRKGVDA